MYAALAEGLPVLQDVDEAIRWANEFVARIDAARKARAEADGRCRPGEKRAAETEPVHCFSLLLYSQNTLRTHSPAFVTPCDP